MLAKSQEVIFRLQGNNFVDYITSTFFTILYFWSFKTNIEVSQIFFRSEIDQIDFSHSYIAGLAWPGLV